MVKRLISAALAVVLACAPVHSDQLLPQGQIDTSGNVKLGPVTLGKRQSGGTTLDVSRTLTATPDASAPTGTLGKFTSDVAPLLSGAFGQMPMKKSGTAGDVVWVNNCINLDTLGGAADGVTDNSPALSTVLTQLLAAPSLGGCIYTPSKIGGKRLFKSKVSAIYASAQQHIRIIGDGRNNTEWYFDTTDGLALTLYNAKSSIAIQDLSLTTGQANTRTGLALIIPGTNSNAALGEYSSINRVTFRGSDGYSGSNAWATALRLNNVSNVNVDDSSFLGTAASLGTGISVSGNSSNSYAVVYNISKSNFLHLNVSIQYGSYVQGMTVAQSNFTAVSNGIYVPPSSAGVLSQLTIVGNQFEVNAAVGGNAINMKTGVNPLIVIGNLFLSDGSNTQIDLSAHSFGTISNNVFYAPSPNNNTAIAMGTGASPFKVNDNVIYGFTLGIGLPSTTSNASITNNQMTGNTTAITNTGTSASANRIMGNSGFQPQAPAPQALTGSPWTYSTPGWPATACVYGGTTSQIQIQGVTVSAGGPGCFPLEPNQSFSVTYSASPIVTIGVR